MNSIEQVLEEIEALIQSGELTDIIAFIEQILKLFQQHKPQ